MAPDCSEVGEWIDHMCLKEATRARGASMMNKNSYSLPWLLRAAAPNK